MEFRKTVKKTLYVREQKRHRCKEQTFELWEKARVGWSERIGLKRVYYYVWNRSPVQFRCMIQGAQGWCTGMTLRDGMGREVGGGFRVGNTCPPTADSCQCMAKPLQYCKVKEKPQRSKNEDDGIQSHHFMANRWGNNDRLYFFGFQNHCRWWLTPWN